MADRAMASLIRSATELKPSGYRGVITKVPDDVSGLLEVALEDGPTMDCTWTPRPEQDLPDEKDTCCVQVDDAHQGHVSVWWPSSYD